MCFLYGFSCLDLPHQISNDMLQKTVEEQLAEEIKHLRSLLQRKEQALAILEGNPISTNGQPLETNTPISLNPLYQYPKSSPTKFKIYSLVKQAGKFITKSELVRTYLIKEGLLETNESKKEATNEVTNALSNLHTAKKVKNYKPENLKMKGGFWGLSDWFVGDQPVSKYLPDLSQYENEEIMN